MSEPPAPVGPEEQEALRRVLEELFAAGVDQQALADAGARGFSEVSRVAARYLTFPGERVYTMHEVYEKAGVDEDYARGLWRAMGFAHPAEDEKAFTERDVEALKIATRLFERAGLARAVAFQQARTMSQAVSRVAFANQDVIAHFIAEPDQIVRARETTALAKDTLPALDALLVYMYRRHLAAATEQQLLIAQGDAAAVNMSVGFADLSRFTSVSRDLEPDELADLVERFNGDALDVIVQFGGRLVKTIGDEVMFASLEAAPAACIALGLLDAVSPERGYPSLRIGLATGDVVAREGDLFGPTVNLANRLVVVARPGTALIDRRMRDALKDDERFDPAPIAHRHLKGVGRVRPYRLRAASTTRA
ncbi:MAG TPA: adenylate/guanylate cyclase domain-containing protein [Actinomycetota bacterium]|nr:adenylate/guanylate cyclase domain-containing protein [Actinomycetota bacterium]